MMTKKDELRKLNIKFDTKGLLEDTSIEYLAENFNMISPFVGRTVKTELDRTQATLESAEAKSKKVLSYGLSSFGYDVRLDAAIRFFESNGLNATIPTDPKNFNLIATMSVLAAENSDGSVTMPPHSYALANSLEVFKLPEDIFCLVLGKSTYARCGVFVNVTPGEPGWHGQWTLEIANLTPRPVKIYPYEGIAQCIFFRGQPPDNVYGKRSGKYNGQRGITPPIM